MSMSEPGLDRHEWESELESLREGLEDAPAQVLPELVDLVRRMLTERGFDPDDPAGGDEREVLDSYRSARDTARRCEAGIDTDTGAGDVGAAVENLLAVYEFLQAERQTP
jgi:hypothetical protein